MSEAYREDKWSKRIEEIRKSVLTDFELKYCKSCSGGGVVTQMRNGKDMFLVITCPVNCNILSKICEYFIERNYEVKYNCKTGVGAFPIILIKNESELEELNLDA